MRSLSKSWKWPVCLVAAGVAACSNGAAENEIAADANVIAAGEATVEAGNSAESNQTAPAGEANAAATAEPVNEASPAAQGNESSGKAAAAAYRASGSEPFWSLSLGSQMVYDSADGPDITVPTPPSRPTRAGPMYVTPQMTVRINQFRRCTAENGEELHDTVEVTIGTQKVSGCGEGDPPS